MDSTASRLVRPFDTEPAEACAQEGAENASDLLPPVTADGKKTRLEKLGVVIEDRKVIRGYERLSFAAAMAVLLREMGEETRVWMLAFLPLAFLARREGSLRFPVGLLPLLAISGCLAMLVVTKMKAGYLAGRYALPVLPLLAMFAVAGVEVLLRYFQNCPPLPWERQWSLKQVENRRGLFAIVALVTLVGVLCVPPWFRPLHASRFGSMAASAWLAEHTRREDVVFDNTGISAFFAGRRNWRPQDRVPRELPIRYAVVDALMIERTSEPELTLLAKIHEQGRLVATFPTSRSKRNIGVYIFELPATQAQIPSRDNSFRY